MASSSSRVNLDASAASGSESSFNIEGFKKAMKGSLADIYQYLGGLNDFQLKNLFTSSLTTYSFIRIFGAVADAKNDELFKKIVNLIDVTKFEECFSYDSPVAFSRQLYLYIINNLKYDTLDFLLKRLKFHVTDYLSQCIEFDGGLLGRRTTRMTSLEKAKLIDLNHSIRILHSIATYQYRTIDYDGTKTYYGVDLKNFNECFQSLDDHEHKLIASVVFHDPFIKALIENSQRLITAFAHKWAITKRWGVLLALCVETNKTAAEPSAPPLSVSDEVAKAPKVVTPSVLAPTSTIAIATLLSPTPAVVLSVMPNTSLGTPVSPTAVVSAPVAEAKGAIMISAAEADDEQPGAPSHVPSVPVSSPPPPPQVQAPAPAKKSGLPTRTPIDEDAIAAADELIDALNALPTPPTKSNQNGTRMVMRLA